jgi:hypothetical protein
LFGISFFIACFGWFFSVLVLTSLAWPCLISYLMECCCCFILFYFIDFDWLFYWMLDYFFQKSYYLSTGSSVKRQWLDVKTLIWRHFCLLWLLTEKFQNKQKNFLLKRPAYHRLYKPNKNVCRCSINYLSFKISVSCCFNVCLLVWYCHMFDPCINSNLSWSKRLSLLLINIFLYIFS